MAEGTKDDSRSPLLQWLETAHTRIPDEWIKTGEQVYARKTLLLASAETLKAAGVTSPFELAATDIFVEKAQAYLTSRANRLMWFGVATTVVALSVMMSAAWYVAHSDPLHTLKPSEVTGPVLALLLFKMTTLGALVGGVIVLLVSLVRALLHEGLLLYNRRHALRFGRLYVYLRHGDVALKDLEEAFQWNVEFTSAFRDIKPGDVTRNRLLELFPETLKKFTKTLAEVRGLLKKQKGDKPADLG